MGFRLAQIQDRAALVLGNHYYDLEGLSGGSLGPDPMAAVAQYERLVELALGLGSASPTGALDQVVLGPPVPRPQKVFAIGLNYQAHADEAAMEIPKYPLVFTKFPSCLVGPTSDVHMRSDRCDYEGELVVAIGRGGRDIEAARAWDHVAGLMVGQDFSDRRVQMRGKPPQFALGKSFDTFGPIGPVLVSLDEVQARHRLRLTTHVNGEARQDDTTDRMIFDVPSLIEYLSRITTLVPGDLIFTGTPEGIGAPQRRYLQDGDVVTTCIEGLGTLVNRCVRVDD